MREWDELVAGALLGTERRPSPSGAVSVGGRDIALVPAEDPSVAALTTAAILGQWRRAGWIAPSAPAPAPEPAPDETLRPCSPRAAYLLQTILDFRAELLPDWLKAAAGAGQVAPPELLPDLLELMKSRRELRAQVEPVLGARGKWLSRLNPEWSAVSAAEDLLEEWETAPRDRRAVALQKLREQDPAAARLLLEASWQTEPPEERARFIAALEHGLGPEDEPFLDRALDDKRKEVRTVAARLLSLLPESALAVRMRDRLLGAVRLEKRFLGSKFEVTPPVECDKAMQRDGIELKVPAALDKVGERAWWLRQIAGACPPSTLPSALGVSASDLLGHAKKSEWSDALVQGWAIAAGTFRDREWALLLLNVQHPPDVLDGLSRAIPAAEMQRLALSRIRELRGRLYNDSLLELTLARGGKPWSLELGREVLAGLRDGTGKVQADNSAGWALRARLKEFAVYAPISLYPESEQGWPESSPGFDAWRKAVADALATLKFRWEIDEEFKR